MSIGRDEAILELLRETNGFVSTQDLSQRLGVPPTLVPDEIEALRQQGYGILLRPESGYRLTMVPDRLLPFELRYRLETSIIGRRIVVYEQTTSTMDVAHQLAQAGEPQGTCVLAESQTGGRGRLGRRWSSPVGDGIYLSLILRPPLSSCAAPQVTLLAAVSVALSIRAITEIPVQVKWPNDIVVQGKKVCGILTEMRLDDTQGRYLVVGIGVNVNTSRDRLLDGATSLRVECGEIVSRIDLCRRLLQQFDEQYAVLIDRSFRPIAELWETFSSISGGHVRVDLQDRVLEGQAVGIDQDGALLVRCDHGVVERVVAGDVVRVR